MADIVTVATPPVTAAAGITIFGVATGLDPGLLVAGLAGGWWGLSYLPPAPLINRLLMSVMASLLSGWLTPVLAAGLVSLPKWPELITIAMVQWPLAVSVGLLTHTVIGPQLIKVATRKAEAA